MAVNRKLRSDLIKLIIFLIVSVTITVSVVATLLDLKLGQPQSGYHAIFANATDLEAGDVVRIAGVEVGKVNGVTVTRDNQAKVDFTVESSQPLTTHALASVQFENLLGQRYLQVSQGAPGGQRLHSGATIPEDQTTPGLDLTAVFTGFQPLLAALNPTQINELTGSIIAILQGQAGAVGNLVDQTARLTSNLASKHQLIDEILNNLTPLLTTVNQDDSQIKQLIDGLDTLVTGLAGQRQQIGDAVTGLSNLNGAASGLLDRVQPALDQDLSGLQTVTGILTQNQGKLDTELGTAIQGLPGLLNALDKASSSGNYLAVYICDLTIATTNPISVKLSPGVPQSPPLNVPTGLIGVPTDHTPVCRPGPVP
ncbi:MAG TPA: MCE family protein [Acidimicrobiales bacterium]|nr:MCE family protein [Acidimicrobiales bacterium]